MTEIRLFKIAASDAELADLRRRIKSTRWPAAEVVDDWSQGIPLAYVQEVAGYWANGYDWRPAKNHQAVTIIFSASPSNDGVQA